MIFYFNQTAFEAYVTVTWANGTCTLSNGNLSYVAPNTSGSHTFTVEEEGTWTATISSDGLTYTNSTAITESGQSKTIDVNCTRYLFRNGMGALVNWTGSGYSGFGGTPTITQNKITCVSTYGSYLGGAGTVYPVNLTGYTTLHCTGWGVYRVYGAGTDAYCFVRTSKTGSNIASGKLGSNYNSTMSTANINISSLSGNCYICFQCTQDANSNVEVSDVWIT